jgi:hypothetical protein
MKTQNYVSWVMASLLIGSTALLAESGDYALDTPRNLFGWDRFCSDALTACCPAQALSSPNHDHPSCPFPSKQQGITMPKDFFR